uniref:Dystroglycan-type cadherin-like domain-containing protein n=1 Tax=Candidatus Kentrum sp. FW TaxID=2126338 RepID=A0A450SES8_9GAMM|nr:MAG: hypothetical protein BECKFW1821A_GA0114235_103025 [Candidatus Kentron sp. FW]VFJ61218.1 MAG: hypothetical protein BECKFW1821B_GA0114236_10647 [Candidatus Kentron sp. FW]
MVTREEMTTGIDKIPVGGYFGFLALEPRIMFAGDSIDIDTTPQGTDGIVVNPDVAETKLDTMVFDYEKGDPILVVPGDVNITFPENADYFLNGYLQFELQNHRGSDGFRLKSGANPDVYGAVSVENKDGKEIVYLGTEKGRVPIGYVVGQDTGTLKIHISIPTKFTNHDLDSVFEPVQFKLTGDKDEKARIEKNWIIGPDEQSLIMPGITTICNYDTPADYHTPGEVKDSALSIDIITSNVEKVDIWDKLKKGENWGYERKTRSGDATTDSSHYLEIWSQKIGVFNEHAAYGPYVCSSQLELIKGMVVSFDWHSSRADDGAEKNGGGDIEDSFFYLLNTDDGTRTLIARGKNTDDSGNVVWRSSEVIVPKTGNYRLVFVAGAIDDQAGGAQSMSATGARLGIDNLRVKFDSSRLLNTIVHQVRYDNTPIDGSLIGSSRELTISVKLNDSLPEDKIAVGTLKFTDRPPDPPGPKPNPDPNPDPGPDPMSTPGSQLVLSSTDNIDIPTILPPPSDFSLDYSVPTVSIDIAPLKPPREFTQNSPGMFPVVVASSSIVVASEGIGEIMLESSRRATLRDASAMARGAEPDILVTSLVTSSCAADGHCISVGRAMEDVTRGHGQFVFRLPHDVFTHTNPMAMVRLRVTLMDDSILPHWIQFDPETGTFSGEVPGHMAGQSITIKVTARDVRSGTEAQTSFEFRVTGGDTHARTPTHPEEQQIDSEGDIDPAGDKGIGDEGNRDNDISASDDRHVDRPGFSAQLAAAGFVGFETRQAAFATMMGCNG